MKICEALMTNNTLTELYLRSDDKDIKWKKKRKEKQEARQKWNRNEMNRRRKQNEMKWTDNNIGDSGAMKIGEALMTNNTLTTLDLGYDDKDIKWKKKKEKKEAR